MDTARCVLDGSDYTAIQHSQIPASARAALRPHLRCSHCGEPAYFRSGTPAGAGRQGRSPHFFSRPHGANCEITRVNADPWESYDGDSTVAHWEERNKKLIVQIRTDDAETAGDGTPVEDGGGGQRTVSGVRTRQSSTLRKGPQRLLEQLVGWPTFKTSGLIIRLPDPNLTEVPVHTAFVRFEQADAELHTSQWHGFWGVVPRLTYWARGGSYYANFGVNERSFRIAIDQSHVPAILSRYGLASINEIVGGYMLLFDIARISTSGRFTADVNSVNHIGFLRAAE